MDAWRWSNCEELAHIQGQRSPSNMVGAGVVPVWHWNNCEEIPHVQGQKSPSKMAGVGAGLRSPCRPGPLSSHCQPRGPPPCLPSPRPCRPRRVRNGLTLESASFRDVLFQQAWSWPRQSSCLWRPDDLLLCRWPTSCSSTPESPCLAISTSW